MEKQAIHKYVYRGPVMSFGDVLVSNWTAETYAPTAAKARANLTYQYKKETNRSASSKVTLPGVIERADREEQIS
jgi:hypothetical protein